MSRVRATLVLVRGRKLAQPVYWLESVSSRRRDQSWAAESLQVLMTT
ncbi:hypothetical protein AB0J63_40545 [Streptosporangium canum]